MLKYNKKLNVHLEISWFKNVDDTLSNKTDFIGFCHMAQSWTQVMENWSAWVSGLECPKCHNFTPVICTLQNKIFRFFQLVMSIIYFLVWTLHYTDEEMDFQSRSDFLKITVEAELSTVLCSCSKVPQSSLSIYTLPFGMSYLTPAICTDI